MGTWLESPGKVEKMGIKPHTLSDFAPVRFAPRIGGGDDLDPRMTAPSIPFSTPYSGPEIRGPVLIRPAISLAQRELIRFLRQRHRIIGALATPIVFWLLIGAGMGRSFHAEGVPGGASGSYLQYFF